LIYQGGLIPRGASLFSEEKGMEVGEGVRGMLDWKPGKGITIEM